MNFAEARFWELLGGGLAVAFVLRAALSQVFAAGRAIFDKLALLGLGLFLLLCVSWVTFAIFLCVAIGTYVGLDWVLRHQEAERYRYLFLMIPLQLWPLAFFKYGDFVANQVLGLDVQVLRGLVIPVGISFYTFQKVAFVVDTLHFRKPLPRFLDYMNFAGFFPQIVAGPIERRDKLLPQMENFRFRFSAEAFNDGASWLVLGLFFKCCLADTLASYFNRSSVSNAYLIWLANLLFGLRIYYDFAGYSLIALGLARILGVELTLNFASPYCSGSITEFWRRWHITLSQWFRDYLYVPLGGGRVRWWALNVAVVFVVSGIWHGAGWNFVLWGALHGAFLILNRLAAPHLRIPAPLAWGATMVASFFAWMAFYELRTPILMQKMGALFTPSAYSRQAFREALGSIPPANQLVLAIFLVLAAVVLILEWQSLRRTNEAYRLLRTPPVLIALIVLTIFWAPRTNNGFIYFAF